jgi:ethanolamine utilization protein EutS
LRIEAALAKSYPDSMSDGEDRGVAVSVPTSRVIQEYVPGRQITIANIIANPDRELCKRVGLVTTEAIGLMTVTPGESAIIAGDLAVKAADVQIGFLDRFSGTLVITGRLSSVELALEAANRGLQEILGFFPARITRT